MKSFDDFMRKMDTIDLTVLVQHLAEKYKTATLSPDDIALNLELSTTILREYHNWLHQD